MTATIATTAIVDLDDLTGTGNAYTIIIGDANVTAAQLNTVNAATTVDVNASAVTTITGTAADLITVYAATGTIDGLGNEAVTITDTSINASALITLDAQTTGIINASSIVYRTASNRQLSGLLLVLPVFLEATL